MRRNCSAALKTNWLTGSSSRQLNTGKTPHVPSSFTCSRLAITKPPSSHEAMYFPDSDQHSATTVLDFQWLYTFRKRLPLTESWIDTRPSSLPQQ